MRGRVTCLLAAALLIVGCPSSKTPGGADGGTEVFPGGDGRWDDGEGLPDGAGDLWDGGPGPADLDARWPEDGDGGGTEGVCDYFVEVDFPCEKHRVCVSAGEYEEFETVPCWAEYPAECCDGASCESKGIFPCPEGTHCEESGEFWEDDECVPNAGCPAGDPGEVLFEFPADGEIRSTPAVGDDGTLYFGTQSATFFAVSCGGTEEWQWKYPCADAWCPQAFEGSPALSKDGAIYIADDIAIPNFLFALGPGGDLLWTWETVLVYGQMDASPAVAKDGTIWAAGHGTSGYVGPLGMVVALDVTGKALPGFPLGTGPIKASPVLYDDVLFAAESGATGKVIAVERTAKVLWSTEIAPSGYETIPSSLAVDGDGMLLVAHQVDLGANLAPFVLLSRISPEDGEVVWQVTVENAAAPAGSPVVAKAAFGMHVAVALTDGRVIVANPYSGGMMFQEVHGSVDFGDFVRGAPVFGDDGGLYIIDAVNMETDAPFMGISRLDLDSGEEETWPIGGSPDIITSSLQMAPGGAIVFGTMSGRLYSWQSAATGPAVEAAWPSFRRDRRNSANGGAPCTPCVPDCTGKECGSDGCGGLCGACPGFLYCMSGEGLCVNADPPQCDGKQCGDDSMGGVCGFCDEGWFCDKAHCMPGAGGCAGIPEGGLCMSGWKVECVDGEPSHTACKFGGCVEDGETGVVQCAEVPCLPDCFGRTCGDDGCGGSCGTCSQDELCGPLSVCQPAEGCGDIGLSGACLGHVLARCVDGALELTPCRPEGLVCAPEGCGGPPACHPVWPDFFPCDGLPGSGVCDSGHLFRCDDGFLEMTDCEGLSWGPCKQVGFYKYGCAL